LNRSPVGIPALLHVAQHQFLLLRIHGNRRLAPRQRQADALVDDMIRDDVNAGYVIRRRSEEGNDAF